MLLFYFFYDDVNYVRFSSKIDRGYGNGFCFVWDFLDVVFGYNVFVDKDIEECFELLNFLNLIWKIVELCYFI